jgi:hypothetical protein
MQPQLPGIGKNYRLIFYQQMWRRYSIDRCVLGARMMFGLGTTNAMGFFSVRSTYRMLVINKERATTYLESIAGRLDIAAVEKKWLAIWKLRIPSKIKVFLWCLACASIPSADVLHHHNMSTHDKCGIC